MSVNISKQQECHRATKSSKNPPLTVSGFSLVSIEQFDSCDVKISIVLCSLDNVIQASGKWIEVEFGSFQKTQIICDIYL
jgi:hypothetical protein